MCNNNVSRTQVVLIQRTVIVVDAPSPSLATVPDNVEDGMLDIYCTLAWDLCSLFLSSSIRFCPGGATGIFLWAAAAAELEVNFLSCTLADCDLEMTVAGLADKTDWSLASVLALVMTLLDLISSSDTGMTGLKGVICLKNCLFLLVAAQLPCIFTR